MSLDYHNGKTVVAADVNGIFFDGGSMIPGDRLLSDPINEIVGTVLLQAVTDPDNDVTYLKFGHTVEDGPSIVVATVEAVGDDLAASGE